MKNETTITASTQLLLWNVHQASEATGIPVNTLYCWASARKIPFVKICGSLRFDPKDIRKWIESNKVDIADWREKRKAISD